MRNKRVISAPALFASLSRWFQRRTWPIPRRLRGVVGNVLRKLSTSAANVEPVDDWSRPLIVSSQLLSAELRPAARSTLRFPSAPDRAHRLVSGNDALRCVVTTSALDAGGMGQVAAFLARRLPEYGIDTFVLHVDASDDDRRVPGGRLADALRADGIPVVDADAHDGARWLAEHDIDVISAHGATSWVLDAAAVLGIPFTETLHGGQQPGWNWEKERDRSRKITTLVAVSELVRRNYVERNSSFPTDGIVTIPNGVNDERHRNIERQTARDWLGLTDEFLFVSLGRYDVQKNTYALVDAFGEVARARPQAHLLVAGRTDDRTYAQQVRLLRDRLPDRQQLHLRDHCSDPAALLTAADAFVMDSFFEGWPLASMEALCAGLPVVTSEVGGAREQVGADGRRGYVVPNPLGEIERVSWASIRSERYRSQSNRDPLVNAMMTVIDEHERWAAERERLAAESLQRFSAAVCLRQHAAMLFRASEVSHSARRT
jgi:glycosyltransferase involved in cell wall biosynthesis